MQTLGELWTRSLELEGQRKTRVMIVYQTANLNAELIVAAVHVLGLVLLLPNACKRVLRLRALLSASVTAEDIVGCLFCGNVIRSEEVAFGGQTRYVTT